MRKVMLLAIFGGFLAVSVSYGDESSQKTKLYDERFRPQFHFSPPQQWMNDPNGMVYWDGEYHLFYQYHPYSNVWGPMHWGHAVSRDLVTWQNLPIALFPDNNGAIWSGSAVVDHKNTSGLGTDEKPPMVAIYTQHDHLQHDLGQSDKYQTQGVSYSLDNGRTWTTYSDNPVLDNPGIRDFRDPKVTWFAPEQKWIMTLAAYDHIRFYSSKNLLEWTFESRFDGWGEADGVWECPDLVEMVVADEDTTRHVLITSINSAAPNGGSGTQYFIGEFDGKTFRLDDAEKSRLARTPAVFPGGDVFANFDDDLGEWKTDGNAYAIEEGPGLEKSPMLSSGSGGDKSTGTAVSPEFEIRKPYINFRISGGEFDDSLGIQLRIDDHVIHRDTGNGKYFLSTRSWDVRDYRGKRAQIELFDKAEGNWGQMAVDDIVFADTPVQEKISPARWLDFGTDNYAGVTWANVPDSDGRLLFLGWMSNWRYAMVVPTERWRSAMTVARELSLVRSGEGLELRSVPVRELSRFREARGKIEQQIVNGEFDLTIPLKVDSPLLDLELTVDMLDAERLSLHFSNAIGQTLEFRINHAESRYELDRSNSGITDFFDGFTLLQTAPMRSNATELDVRVLIDRSSVEVFVNGGETVMTALVFPEAPYEQLALVTPDRVRIDAAAYQVPSIWSEKR